MDPWKRLRLTVCLAAMLMLLVVAGYAYIAGEVPDEPFGRLPGRVRLRTANPFECLEHDVDLMRHIVP